MNDLSCLLTAHSFPAALPRVRRSFTRQPDNQTCGAAAIRHGLLLGGLTTPTASLEALLGIRQHEGTPPTALRRCLERLGLEVEAIEKPPGRPTARFLDSLKPEFEQGAFLLPCIHKAEHWVCVGGWHRGRVGLIDSFIRHPRTWGLGFRRLSAAEFDRLDWNHHVHLVRPGVWSAQYAAWQPARLELLKLASSPRTLTLGQALRQSVHQYLDDADYDYRGLTLHPGTGVTVRIRADDPGRDAAGLEIVRQVAVVRRLRGLLTGKRAAPEVVVRLGSLAATQLG